MFVKDKNFLPHVADLFICPKRGVGYITTVDSKCRYCKVIWFSEGLDKESTHYYESIKWNISGLKYLPVII